MRALRSALRLSLVCLLLVAPLAGAATYDVKVWAAYDGDRLQPHPTLGPVPERGHCLWANVYSSTGSPITEVVVEWDDGTTEKLTPPAGATSWGTAACHSYGLDTALYHSACFTARNEDGRIGRDCVGFRTYV